MNIILGNNDLFSDLSFFNITIYKTGLRENDDKYFYWEEEDLIVPIYEIESSIDYKIEYENTKDIVIRAFQILVSNISKKIKNDVWQTVICAGTNNPIQDLEFNYESLVQLKQNNPWITDLFISPELEEKLEPWELDFKITTLDELGENQEYTKYANENFFKCNEFVIALNNTHGFHIFLPDYAGFEVSTDSKQYFEGNVRKFTTYVVPDRVFYNCLGRLGMVVLRPQLLLCRTS